ncbi:CPBP family intramembrane glutamic endopeptidase [Actinomyces sp. MRS3W]|uniref:CPBP family intramembrane glutamic endopeptidase n=1 Tax=Actinomyces sp. MRS3W TaxID=2800796 RepID=UPI0028FD9F9C|nr:CPBP family intramembrane glutamic endopeptidase [Actinomyces sp. MRS3W]MDU0349184.1 CPBP family intramembrane glutamic endopeptidase [Actinomyces sp. MRS3W]
MLFGVFVFIAAQLSTYVGMGIMSALIGETDTATVTSEMTDIGSSPVSFLGGSLVSALIAVGGYWGCMRLIRGARVGELAGGGKVHEFLTGVLIGGLLITVVVLVLAAFGAYRVTTVGWHPGVIVGLAMGVAAGFAEEILFRGLLLRLLEHWLGTVWAVAATSLLFGLAHLGNPEATVFGALAIAVEAGVLLGACYLVTRRLWLVFGVHLAWNFVQGGVFGSDVSGTGSGRGLFEASFTGPELLTGGEMGIEGSLVAVLVCGGMGVLIMQVAHRRGLLFRRRTTNQQEQEK